MSRVFITKTTVATAFGFGLDELFHSLVAGRTSLSRVTRFDTSRYISKHAGMIADLSFEKEKACPVNQPRILTLVDRLVRDIGTTAPDALLITASTKGAIELLEDCHDRKIPLPRGLMVSDLPGIISKKLHLYRSGFNISAACASSTVALAKGAQMIRDGREHTVIIIGVDLVSEFVFSGFSAIGAMSPDPARPFDIHRTGLTLGEGGALLVLASEKELNQTNKTPLAEIIGWGIAGDAAHLTAPARDGAGLKSAIEKACRSANLLMDRIRIISCHGTGTLYNDAMELAAIRALFSPQSVMANSIKGAIGHTLGAAGAIEAALCIKMLNKGSIPGTIGLQEQDTGAEEIFSSLTREFDAEHVLTINSGFGGINAALILKDAP
ncbi:MAG: hypothetical protein LC660_10180 [Desulfobacteraceae bacterium]|nr:hypothetical protein [Desulfobacteraceae bacterium]